MYIKHDNINNLQIFSNTEFGEIEVIVLDGKEWFGATQIAKALGYANPYKAVIDHCKEDGLTKREVIDSMGRTQEMKFINEGNLYRLIVKSKLPTAEKFERWVFDDVLPTIHKHGAYMTSQKIEEVLLNPDTIIRLATDLKHEQEMTRQLENQIEQDKPYTSLGQAIATSSDSINIGQFCKMVYDREEIKIGRNRMFGWLREKGYLVTRGKEKNHPKQQYLEQGLFEVASGIVKDIQGDIQTFTTLMTGKGQMYFLDKLKMEWAHE